MKDLSNPTNKEAREYAYALIKWARDRWGVEMETKYICPNCDSVEDYDGYCSSDGRKLKETEVESERQDWRHNLEDFIYLPEYPAPPSPTDVKV